MTKWKRMKTALFFILLSSVVSFSQTKNDTIDFNKVNYTLLNDLIFQKHNEEREKEGSQLRIKATISTLFLQNDFILENAPPHEPSYELGRINSDCYDFHWRCSPS